MKRISKIVLVLMLLVAAAFTAIACNTNAVQSISIAPGDEPPKMVYIIGEDNELVTFGGFLTITYENGNTERIQLDDPNIVISGFDAQKAGKQELTITYGEKTCPLTVTVTRRLSLEGGVTDYFVGEPFDRSGTLVLTEDNGATRTVPFNDASVSVNGISDFSATVGDKILTVSYANYTSELPIKVYELADASLSLGKNIYDSHEDGIDLNTSKIVLKNREAVEGKDKFNGAFQKEVPLTRTILAAGNSNDQATFDSTLDELLEKAGISAAPGTEEVTYNSNVSVKKDISFTYAGKQLNANITINLSRASFIMFYAGKYSGIDFSQLEDTGDPDVEGDVIMYNDFQKNGDQVKYVAQMYFKDLADKSVVDTNLRDDLVRLAAYYWYDDFINVINEVNADGQIFELYYDYVNSQKIFRLHTTFTDEDNDVKSTYENTKAMYDSLIGSDGKHTEKLAKVDEAIDNLYLILGDTELANVIMTTYEDGPVSIETYFVLTVSRSELNSIFSDLKKVLDLYDIIANDEVKLSEVENLSSVDPERKSTIEIAIRKVYSAIVPTQDAGSADPAYDRANYYLLKEWNKEFFDILYQYYWDMANDTSATKDQQTIGWNSLVYLAYYAILPSDDFENFYSTANYLLNIINLMMTSDYVVDATEAYYYYDQVVELHSKLGHEENELYKNIYENVGLMYPIVSEMYGGPVDVAVALNVINDYYSQFSNIASVIPSIKTYLDYYIDVYGNFQSGDYLEYDEETRTTKYTEKFNTDVKKLIDDFFALSPADAFFFMNAISFYDIRMLDLSSINTNIAPYTYFTTFITSYYDNILNTDEDSETSSDAYNALNLYFYAYETFLRHYVKDENGNWNSLFDTYKDAENAYRTLGSEQQKSIKFAYDKLHEIIGLFDDSEELETIDISSIDNDEWEGKVEALFEATRDFYYNYMCSQLQYYVTLPYILTAVKFEDVYETFIPEYEALKSSNPTLYDKINKVLNYGEYDVFSVMQQNGEPYVIMQPMAFTMYSTMSNFILYAAEDRFDFGGVTVSIEDLLNNELNEGMKDMYAEIADYVIPAQYMFTMGADETPDFDFDKLDEAIAVFGKFFNVSNSDYTMDQKMALWYTTSELTTSLDLFALSSMSYYARLFSSEQYNFDATTRTALTNAVGAYVALIEGYLYYQNLLDYTAEMIENLGEDRASYYQAVETARTDYTEARTEFNNAHSALSGEALRLFDEKFTTESQNIFKADPIDR